MIGVIVLAAGESRRMGFPKALLRYRDMTFLESILAASAAAGLDPSIVVLGPDAHKILASVMLDHVVEARNDHPETGQIGSIRQGISAIINRPVEGAVIWPVDQPQVSVGTVERLIEAYRNGGASVVVPAHEGRRGHPVLFGRDVFDDLLSAPINVGARAVVREQQERGRLLEVPVTDAAILEDIDTPEAYEDLLRRSTPGG
jgi:CTP:molybdopterin cytidylyltransferase MocA